MRADARATPALAALIGACWPAGDGTPDFIHTF
jgi:hypothetical protein